MDPTLAFDPQPQNEGVVVQVKAADPCPLPVTKTRTVEGTSLASTISPSDALTQQRDFNPRGALQFLYRSTSL